MTKVDCEILGMIYHEKYGVDIRGIRYPGLISWKSLVSGGTTDYAVDIFHAALSEESTYDCFLSAQTRLPMMYMDDAIKATINIMQAPSEKIKIRSFYAPNHTYDKNTLAALKNSGINEIIDGYGLMPYTKNQIKFIPKLFYKVFALPFGIQATQINLNYWKQIRLVLSKISKRG